MQRVGTDGMIQTIPNHTNVTAVVTGSKTIMPPAIMANGGTLIGGTRVPYAYATDVPEESVIRLTPPIVCNSSYACDVPGPETTLCWTARNNSWTPKQRTTYPAGQSKWPANARVIPQAGSYTLLLNR
jgi:hypothetical protein